MKPLSIMILEEQMRRLQKELDALEGIPTPSVSVPNELAESQYLNHTPVNSGPDYLTVRASSWHNEMVTEFGVVHHLADARYLASKHGLKGISVVFGEQT